MENERTYLGITYQAENEVNVNDLYNEVGNGDNRIYISKETFKHGEDNEPFNNMTYKLVILCQTDSGLEIKNENGEDVYADYYTAYLVPTTNLIHESKVRALMDCYGWENETIENALKEFDEGDFANEGYGVLLGDYAEETQDEFNMGVINGFATALETINSMRGFYLDRVMNGIGMTGWDFLEMTLTDKSFADYVWGSRKQ